MDCIFENNYENVEYQKYVQEVDEFLRKNISIWDETSEKIYWHLNQIREKYLKNQDIAIYKKEKINRKSSLAYGKGKIFQKHIADDLRKKKNAVVVVINDLDWVSFAIQDILSLLRQGKQVFWVIKEYSIAPLFTKQELKDVDLLFSNNELEKFSKSGALQYIVDENESCGTNFERISFSADFAFFKERQDIYLLGYGEDAFLSIHDLEIPSIAFTTNKTIFAKSVLNEYTDGLKFLVYIPSKMNIYSAVSITESPLISYAHYQFLADTYGTEIYEDDVYKLRENYPEIFLNIFSDNLKVDATILQSFPAKVEFLNECELSEVKLDAIEKGRYKKENFTVKSIYYKHNTEMVGLPKGWENKTLINILLTSQAKSANAMMIDDYGDLSFREYARQKGLLKETNYLCNFLFFTTPYLINRYNNFRKERPQEQITMGCEHIDFFRRKQGDTFTQTLPLYNKACISKDATGKFHFFNYILAGGSVQLNGTHFSWVEKDVNPQFPSEVAVYTPMLSRNEQEEKMESTEYIKLVGLDRLNLVIIGSKIVCMRQGDVMLPSIGVVLSFSGKAKESVEKIIKARLSCGGYYEAINDTIELYSDPPKGISIEEWNNTEWSFGGGIALLHDGNCIFDEGENSTREFQKEGWLTPLSIQTQESKTHDEVEIHPRTLLGITKNNTLFVIVFSGRSRYSRGVTYKEACDIAKKYIDDIQYMMAVDGGGSSFLGVTQNDTFMELSYPACTEVAGTGIVRKINSLLLL